MKEKTVDGSWWRCNVSLVLLSFLILSIFFSYDMGNRPFADPDEGRYVEISREMLETGDYVTPRLNGLKYFEKPPLFYWMQALSMKIFGLNEVSMRLWVVFFAILGCMSVFFVGSRYHSNRVGLMSAGILATNVLYYVHSRLILLDLVVSVLISGALWCFYVAFVQEKHDPPWEKYWIVAMYALSALACLAKGLIGVVLPALVALLWLTLTGSIRKIWKILDPSGIMVFLIIFLPWHILMGGRNGDFLHFYFVVEHFLRYTTTVHCRHQPVWFFIPVLLLGFLPWTGFALVALKRAVQKSINGKNSENIFFLCWIFGILGFFSCSNSKLMPYILPVTQPIALLTSVSMSEYFHAKREDFRNAVWINVGLFFAVSLTYLLAKNKLGVAWDGPEMNVLINTMFLLMWIMAVIWLFAVYSKILKLSCLLCTFFLSANMMWIVNKAAVFFQETTKPSTKRFAEIIKLNKNDGDLIFCYKRYYQDFPVYLRSTVKVVDFVGELEFGANAEKNNGKLISNDDFWALWKTARERIFLLMSRDNYREVFRTANLSHKVLDFNRYFIVIINR
ncbi:MAG: glycosyltransferase family 39 protein [Holosporaceae bacterium]|jgi:4-amino-4-deoxy-L-arabinose transferase-like glycosyltransferase|nr:glycosyltransferase family 39 protein [Holosporaceae bacterium]